MPLIEKKTLKILDPCVGIGVFLPFIVKFYSNYDSITIDVFDIDKNMLKYSNIFLSKLYSKNIIINTINDNFLEYSFENKYYDIIIGNPPFKNTIKEDHLNYAPYFNNEKYTNMCSYFLRKSIDIGDYVIMIVPKQLLTSHKFMDIRNILSKKRIYCIQDFESIGFEDVLIETICLFIDTKKKVKDTEIINIPSNILNIQKQEYICDEKYPNWLIYRNKFFDNIANSMLFDCYSIFRDRQITKKLTTKVKNINSIRVLKSKNISLDGSHIIDIDGYDEYIPYESALSLKVYHYYNNFSVFLTPNMTYYPRVIKNPGNILFNGSVVVLINRKNVLITKNQLDYYLTKDFR